MERRAVASICIILMLQFFITSCGPQPRGVLSQKKMQSVMSDVMLAEQVINMDNVTFYNDSTKKMLYKSVFDKHHITEAVYDSSLIWYGKNLDIYMKLYDRVIADYQKRLDALEPKVKEGEEKERINRTQNTQMDTLDIWSDNNPSSIAFNNHNLVNGITFSMQPMGGYPMNSTFVFKMKSIGIKGDRTPIVRMSVVQQDTTQVVDGTINSDGSRNFMLAARPDKGLVLKVTGFILMSKGSATDYRSYVNDIQLLRIIHP
jgi:hypothetical protein